MQTPSRVTWPKWVEPWDHAGSWQCLLSLQHPGRGSCLRVVGVTCKAVFLMSPDLHR